MRGTVTCLLLGGAWLCLLSHRLPVGRSSLALLCCPAASRQWRPLPLLRRGHASCCWCRAEHLSCCHCAGCLRTCPVIEPFPWSCQALASAVAKRSQLSKQIILKSR
jgi:hypothetical protein